MCTSAVDYFLKHFLFSHYLRLVAFRWFLFTFKQLNALQMTPLKLNEAYSLAIEPSQKKVRLVVYKNGVENVCRRDTIVHLEHFILSDEERIFKGRLQLCKSGDSLNVEVKGDTIGTLKFNDFINFLEQAKTVYI